MCRHEKACLAEELPEAGVLLGLLCREGLQPVQERRLLLHGPEECSMVCSEPCSQHLKVIQGISQQQALQPGIQAAQPLSSCDECSPARGGHALTASTHDGALCYIATYGTVTSAASRQYLG